MDFVAFHKALSGSDPTPKQVSVYQHLSSSPGKFTDTKDEGEFLAVFIACLASTIDPDSRAYRKVYLFLPPALKNWATETVNKWLQALRNVPIDPQVKSKRNKGLVQAIDNVVWGHRLLTLREEPALWMTYGFGKGSPVPAWFSAKVSA